MDRFRSHGQTVMWQSHATVRHSQDVRARKLRLRFETEAVDPLVWPRAAETYAGKKSFRLYAYYRMTGALAAAFDPDGGGFIQYPGGGVMLMYQAG